MPVRARAFKKEDIPEIAEIHKRQPDLGVPSRDNVIVNCTFETLGKGPSNPSRVAGYGVLKVFAEAVLIIDKGLRKIDKGRAVSEGMKIALDACRKQGIENLHIFVDTKRHPGYSKILQKHFGAKVCSGETLLIKVGESD